MDIVFERAKVKEIAQELYFKYREVIINEEIAQSFAMKEAQAHIMEAVHYMDTRKAISRIEFWAAVKEEIEMKGLSW